MGPSCSIVVVVLIRPPDRRLSCCCGCELLTTSITSEVVPQGLLSYHYPNTYDTYYCGVLLWYNMYMVYVVVEVPPMCSSGYYTSQYRYTTTMM